MAGPLTPYPLHLVGVKICMTMQSSTHISKQKRNLFALGIKIFYAFAYSLLLLGANKLAIIIVLSSPRGDWLKSFGSANVELWYPPSKILVDHACMARTWRMRCRKQTVLETVCFE